MRKYVLFCLIGWAWATAASAQVPSQTAPVDTVRAAKPALNKPSQEAPVVPEPEDNKEIDLEAIEIQAVVEKPNVDIISKRTEPEWEETRFIERSFDAELKRAPKNLMIVDDELDRAQKLETLKKTETKSNPE